MKKFLWSSVKTSSLGFFSVLVLSLCNSVIVFFRVLSDRVLLLFSSDMGSSYSSQ